MPRLARPCIDEARVEPVRPGQRQREPGAVVGRQDQVRVVGHQAIGPAGDAGPTARLGEPVLIETKILQLEEYPLASIAALGDVMRQAGDDNAGDAGHEGTMTRRHKKVKTVVSP